MSGSWLEEWEFDPSPFFTERYDRGGWWWFSCHGCSFGFYVHGGQRRAANTLWRMRYHLKLDCPGGREPNTGDRH